MGEVILHKKSMRNWTLAVVKLSFTCGSVPKRKFDFSQGVWDVGNYQNLSVSFFFQALHLQAPGLHERSRCSLRAFPTDLEKAESPLPPPSFAIHLQDGSSASLTNVYSSSIFLLLLRKCLFRDVGAALLVQVIHLHQESMCWCCVVLDRSSLVCNLEQNG